MEIISNHIVLGKINWFGNDTTENHDKQYMINEDHFDLD